MFENKVKNVKKRRREEGKDEKETQRIRETKVKRRKLKLETRQGIHQEGGPGVTELPLLSLKAGAATS